MLSQLVRSIHNHLVTKAHKINTLTLEMPNYQNNFRMRDKLVSSKQHLWRDGDNFCSECLCVCVCVLQATPVAFKHRNESIATEFQGVSHVQGVWTQCMMWC